MKEIECVAFTQDELVQFKQELKNARIKKFEEGDMSQEPIADFYGEVVYAAKPESVSSESLILSNYGSLDYAVDSKAEKSLNTQKASISREEFGDY